MPHKVMLNGFQIVMILYWSMPKIRKNGCLDCFLAQPKWMEDTKIQITTQEAHGNRLMAQSAYPADNVAHNMQRQEYQPIFMNL